LDGQLWVCTGGEAQADLITASFGAGGFAGSTLAAANGGDCTSVKESDVTSQTMFGAKTTYAAPDDVISGSAENDGASTTWTPTGTAEIYFDAAATNAAQNGTVAFSFLIQALQYRNNTVSPTEAQWNTVTTTSFSL